MGLETGTYISDLVAANPTSGDGIVQGDDHLRLVKTVLKNSFPNVNGPLTASMIPNVAAGGIAATTVQAAIDELDAEKQPKDATLTALAGVTTAVDKLIYATGVDTFGTTDLASFIRTLLDDPDAWTARETLGLNGVPPLSKAASYTLALTDSGFSVDFTGSTGQTITIPANASVAFPVGTTITFTNLTANNLSIAITTDTLRQGGTANTGTRTLGQYGVATARKVSSTVWIITGSGLS